MDSATCTASVIAWATSSYQPRREQPRSTCVHVFKLQRHLLLQSGILGTYKKLIYSHGVLPTDARPGYAQKIPSQVWNTLPRTQANSIWAHTNPRCRLFINTHNITGWTCFKFLSAHIYWNVMHWQPLGSGFCDINVFSKSICCYYWNNEGKT